MFWKKSKNKKGKSHAEEEKALADFNHLLKAVEADELALIRLDHQVEAEFSEIASHIKDSSTRIDRLLS